MSNGYVYVGAINNPYAYGQRFAQGVAEQMPQIAPYVGSRLANQYQIEQGDEETLAGALGMGGLFMGAMQLPKVFRPINTYNAIKDANTLMKGVRESEAFKKLSAVEQNKAYSEIFEIGRKTSKISEEALKKAGRTPEDIKEIRNLFNTAKANFEKALKAGNTAEAARYSAEMNTIISTSKKQGLFGRAISKVFHPTKAMPEAVNSLETVKNAATSAGKEATKGATEAINAAKAAQKAGTTAKAVNWTKDALKSGGWKGFAAISGAIEGLTEVLPAFVKGGANEGVKQTAKSAVNVAADIAGWCVGAKAGAAAGAAIGSIIPGAGTAVGAVIGGVLGFVGGMVGSHFARKGVKAVIGKSYSEKQNEKEKQMEKAQEAQIAAYQQAVAQTQAAQPIKQRQAAFRAYPNPYQMAVAGLPSYASNPFATNDLLGLDNINYDFSNPAGM